MEQPRSGSLSRHRSKLFGSFALWQGTILDHLDGNTNTRGRTSFMASGRASPLLRFIRGIAAGTSSEPTDGQLLNRFVTERDEEAFATLMRRHGPMVLHVCQSVLLDGHDAEDAFQATFLVLVRKARSIGKPQSVGSWLHGVAYRLAAKARVAAARRRARERQTLSTPVMEPLHEVIARDLRLVLHEEVARLPERHRAPFVLCYLEGKTNEEAAQLLGWPKGTVLSSLSRARERLRHRLTRRGLAVTGGLLAALSGNAAPAAVPDALLSATLNAVKSFAVSGTVAGAASAQVLAMTKGALNSMFLTKLKIALAILLAGGAAAAGAMAFAHHQAPGEKIAITVKEPKSDQQPKEADKPKEDKALHGRWVCVEGRVDDQAIAEATRRGLQLLIDRDSYETVDGKVVLFSGKYQVDPDADPKTIDIIATAGPNKGKASKGIYLIEEGMLRLCYGQPGKERPKKFASPRDSGVTLVVWKRP
jgi:RNA polymerase sigma factor (sigma-70 family)